MTLKEMPKVGEKVRYTTFEGYEFMTEGKEYEVTEVHKDWFVISDDDGDTMSWNTFEFDSFELVDEPVAEQTIEYEGVEYRKVKRMAEVGELVYVISCAESPELDFNIGKCMRNDRFDDGSIDVDIATSVYGNFGFLDGLCDEYLVLEPIDSEPTHEPTPVEASPTVIELLANISRRLYEAEKEITELNEKQAIFFDIDKLLKKRIFDLERQNRVQAYEINELYREVADIG